jgi:serine/threonine protein kinase
MEFVSEGDLYEILNNSEDRFQEESGKFLFRQILKGLNYLHNTAGLCHGDIKPQNILINPDF